MITQWGWGDLYAYAHDQIATDKRDPTLYPDGKIWGVDLGNDRLLSVNPTTNEADELHVPTVGGFATPWGKQVNGFKSLGDPAPGGTTAHPDAYDNPANPHNPMMDDTGKVWITTQIRSNATDQAPAFCNADPVIADNFHHRQLGYYDTKTKAFQLIDTCYGTHHLQFDENGRLWTSGDSFVLGWFDPEVFDPARPETLEKARAGQRMKVNSDGDGVKDTPTPGFNYGIIPNPVNDTVWTGRLSGGRGDILRYDPATDEFEVYKPPAPGYGPRGVNVDTKGIIWTGLGGSGHLAKFDRSKCKQTWGTGDQCPEGWDPLPQPRAQDPDRARGRRSVTNADFHYYLWDQHEFNTLGQWARSTVVLRRHWLRLAARLRPQAQRSVSHHSASHTQEPLHPGARRAHRRPEDRLEGPRAVVRQRHRPRAPLRGAAVVRGQGAAPAGPLARGGHGGSATPRPGSGGGWRPAEPAAAREAGESRRHHLTMMSAPKRGSGQAMTASTANQNSLAVLTSLK